MISKIWSLLFFNIYYWKQIRFCLFHVLNLKVWIWALYISLQLKLCTKVGTVKWKQVLLIYSSGNNNLNWNVNIRNNFTNKIVKLILNFALFLFFIINYKFDFVKFDFVYFTFFIVADVFIETFEKNDRHLCELFVQLSQLLRKLFTSESYKKKQV